MLYYSGWLQNPKTGANYSISDEDKNGFMACCPKKAARKKGLDLILHTPGGRVDATESLIISTSSMKGISGQLFPSWQCPEEH